MVSRGTGIDGVRARVVDEPVRDDDKPAVAGWLQRLCRAASDDLAAYAAGVSLISEGGEQVTAAVSTPEGAALEELQFSLGEGPCLLAHSSRSPVMVPDLAEMAGSVWPAYAREALAQGVLAVFAFPLQVGSVRLGALDVYRDEAGPFSASQTTLALNFADLATEALLDAGSTADGTSALIDDGDAVPLEVYQAQGMLMVHLGVDGAEALARLRGRAFAQGCRLAEVADEVISRRIVWEQDEP